jgi:hypothetical protein
MVVNAIKSGHPSSMSRNNVSHVNNYQSKNVSMLRETTPLKTTSFVGLSSSQHPGSSKHKLYSHQQLGLNSEERKKLFNTFMKEMNQSLQSTQQSNLVVSSSGGGKQKHKQ